MSRFTRFASSLLGLSALTLLSACSGVSTVATSSGVPSIALRGSVHGGQQAVAGATIQLYSVGTTGDASAATALGSSTTTASDGSFSLTGKYNCTNATNGVNTLVYILSTGGNPGSGTNPNLIMMAALGQCSSLTSSTFIFIDEVTTIGSIAALYNPYMTSATNLGSGSSDALAAGVGAFGNVAVYTNTSTGTAPGPTLPSGYYASSTEINTLSNILASCVNSTGGAASGTNSSDGTACGNLFNLTRNVGGVAPTNTIAAILNILNNPTQNASSLFSLPQPIAPFQPSLSAAPTTWALPVRQIATTPSISVTGGTYSSAQFVTLSDGIPFAVIHYTTDGTTPTASSPTYTGFITVSSSETLTAIAIASGYANSASASAAYTITGSTGTYSLSGNISLANNCGSTSVPPITITLAHSGLTIQTTTTNGTGSFSFSGVPNASYTVTPSITGPSAVFFPSVRTPTINGGDLVILPIIANIGYTVSGTVAYSGSKTGQTYLSLNPTSCGGGGTTGTSISSKGAFTIRGVAPGGYTLQAFMDNIAVGAPNASNPAGSSAVAVSNANLTGQTVTLVDPAAVTVTSAPTIQGASGFNTGAVVQYKAITSNGVETPSSYTLQWSTDPAFGTVTSKTFAANGTKADAWFFTGLTNGSILYFRAYGSSAGTPVGPISNVYGPVTIGAPTGGNTVSGSVSFSQTPTGPLYVGLLSQTTGNFYAQYFPSPASAQAYSIQAPSDTYNFFAILDQNSNGLIDTGDIQDATDSTSSSSQSVTISGATPNLNLTLPTASSIASVTTQDFRSTNGANVSQNYNLNFRVAGLTKRPVAVNLNFGPNAISPVDIAICSNAANSCSNGFQISFSTAGTAPAVNDTYSFNVTYSDSTTGVLFAHVTAVLGNFATALAPTTGSSVSTTPTFSWTDPLNASNFTYQFYMNDSVGNQVWQVPGNNSNSSGFSSSTTSLTWGIDPNDPTNTPTPATLTLGANYSWSLTVQDSNGNAAIQQVQYQP
jgi:Chitobiase/beta-hexosaminidase C-terminal domain